MKNDLWYQKWHNEFGKQVIESKADKSSVFNVLADVLNVFTVCLKWFKFFVWFWKPGVNLCINFAPFRKILGKI